MFLTHRVPTGRLQRPLKGNQYGGLYTTGEVLIFIRVHTSASLGRFTYDTDYLIMAPSGPIISL